MDKKNQILARANWIAILPFLTSPFTFAEDATPVPAGLQSATQGQAPGAPAGAAAQQPGFGSMLVPLLLMFGVMYFLMIRPQQKKMKQHQEMLKALSQGDEVVTASGILGKVAGLTEKIVTVEVANNVKIKFLKSQISQVLKGQEPKELT